MKRKLTWIIAATGLLAVGLSGCAGAEGKVDAKPAPGSPDLESVVTIFKDLPLAGHELVPFNEDESSQLRQQIDSAGDLVRIPENKDRVRFEPSGSGCPKMMQDSFNLPLLHWPSLAAQADGQAAAQLFLAPSAKAAQDFDKKLDAIVPTCDEVTVTAPTGTVKMSLSPLDPFEGCPNGYRQTVTRESESQTLDVCYVTNKNAVLAMTVVDSSDSSAVIAKDFMDFSTKFFARLKPLYTE